MRILSYRAYDAVRVTPTRPVTSPTGAALSVPLPGEGYEIAAIVRRAARPGQAADGPQRFVLYPVSCPDINPMDRLTLPGGIICRLLHIVRYDLHVELLAEALP